MMTRGHRQEALCRAYVQAIAAQAGLLSSGPELDYGIDLSLRMVTVGSRGHTDTSFQLDLQLKSTTRASVTDREVKYDLDADSFEYLCLPDASFAPAFWWSWSGRQTRPSG